jgi:HK97 family phage major capsid protein
MEIYETIEAIEERMSAIKTELETADEARLDELNKEVDALEARKAEIRAAIEERKKDVAEIVNGNGTEIEKIEERKTMTIEEVRNSKEYINAFANYIKTGKDAEARALLTENVNGTLPVPTVIEGRIRTAWERSGLMELVRKTYVRGNVKVGFELSATGAVVHVEGTDAPDPETLTFGIAELKAESIKKYIEISDEAMDMGGEEFLYYVYDEITYRIAKEAQKQLLTKIAALPAAATANSVSANKVTGTPSLGIVATAIANLSDEAANPVIVMNKLTYAAFKAAQYAAQYAVDPFENLPVHFDNSLKAFSAASAGDVWAIVGDFGTGAQANFPNGDEITLKFDQYTKAPEDLVRIIGREYIGVNAVADKAFALLVK